MRDFKDNYDTLTKSQLKAELRAGKKLMIWVFMVACALALGLAMKFGVTTYYITVDKGVGKSFSFVIAMFMAVIAGAVIVHIIVGWALFSGDITRQRSLAADYTPEEDYDDSFSPTKTLGIVAIAVITVILLFIGVIVGLAAYHLSYDVGFEHDQSVAYGFGWATIVVYVIKSIHTLASTRRSKRPRTEAVTAAD